MRIPIFCLSCLMLVLRMGVGYCSDEDTVSIPPSLHWAEDLSIGGSWYMGYENGEREGEKFSEFRVRRGYINIKKRFTSYLSGRITPDISVDREGDGEGDLEMRLKYCYANFSPPSWGVFVEPEIEFGLVHRPWLDFESKLNGYRVQGSMFLERNDVFNSGDYGVTVSSYLGGVLKSGTQEYPGLPVPGKYGSLSFGLYNGGGYHAIERNKNKTFESRLTLRPLPFVAPGVQVSYCGVLGKGNTESMPDWDVHALFVSWQFRQGVFTTMLYRGRGDYKGAHLDANGNAADQSGYSFFSRLSLPQTSWSLMARYEHFSYKDLPETVKSNRMIIGVAYTFYKKCMILLDYDKVTYSTEFKDDEAALKGSVQLVF